MIKLFFRQTAPTGGDETAPYDVLLEQKCSVDDFVTAVLNRREWGYITIKGRGQIEYRYDELVSTTLNCDDMSKLIKSVHAAGGWGSMDYYLEIIA